VLDSRERPAFVVDVPTGRPLCLLLAVQGWHPLCAGGDATVAFTGLRRESVPAEGHREAWGEGVSLGVHG
jgi:hypothetical protein